MAKLANLVCGVTVLASDKDSFTSVTKKGYNLLRLVESYKSRNSNKVPVKKELEEIECTGLVTNIELLWAEMVKYNQDVTTKKERKASLEKIVSLEKTICGTIGLTLRTAENGFVYHTETITINQYEFFSNCFSYRSKSAKVTRQTIATLTGIVDVTNPVCVTMDCTTLTTFKKNVLFGLLEVLGNNGVVYKNVQTKTLARIEKAATKSAKKSVKKSTKKENTQQETATKAESTEVVAESTAKVAESTPASTVEPTATTVTAESSYNELRKALKAAGLSTKGKKDELVKRCEENGLFDAKKEDTQQEAEVEVSVEPTTNAAFDKKYELTEESIDFEGTTLHRIRAIRSFNDVKAGDLGGFIEKESNLSHEGNAWVYDRARVYGCHATVRDNATICDNAIVRDNATICDNAIVRDNAYVRDNATVCGYAYVYGEATVCDNAYVRDNATVCDNATVDSSNTTKTA